MRVTAGICGVYGIPWSACLADDGPFEDTTALSPGAAWRWTGQPVRLDGPQGIFLLEEGAEQRRLRAGVARWHGRADPPPQDEGSVLGGTVELTDGARVFRMAVLPEAQLVVFAEGLPPPGLELWVLRCPSPVPSRKAEPVATASFLAATAIATPDGPRPAESLLAGDLVLTADDGPQRLTHVTRQFLSGAELFLWPGLRPVRVCAGALGAGMPRSDLRLAPDHRVVVSGPAVSMLFGEAEVLVRIGDLVDHRTIRPDHGLRQAEYIHLGLHRHQVLVAEGTGCESLQPDPDAAADTSPLDRRVLDLGEAALLSHGLARG
jgi:hypothetical protein